MGYVYILTNETFRYGLLRRKLIKIGKTNRDPNNRAKELSSSTGVPTPFKVEHSLPSDQPDELEREIHRRLDAYRSNKDREFFKYSVEKAIKLLEELNKGFSPVELQPAQFETGAVKKVSEDNRFIGNLHISPRDDNQIKLGVNGKPYHSQDNGFSQAVKAKGIPLAIRPHVTIIIDNEELEIPTSLEQLESRINEARDEIEKLEKEKEVTEDTIIKNQEQIIDNKQILEGLKSIDALEDEISEKTEEYNDQQVKVAGLEADLEKFPTEEGISKHRQLRLYPVFGAFCVILSLALYFFYVSALDKAFFSTIDIGNAEVASYARLNEIFDPTAIFKTFRKWNFWLCVAPFFPLALAFSIHPCIGSAAKGLESGRKLRAMTWVTVIIFILLATLVLDSLLALQISKKIHDSEILLGLVETEVWLVTPTNPFTWDMNIYIVLFFGFVVSLLLGLLFHFTLEMWKEARMQIVDDRNSIVKELSRVKAVMKALDKEVTRLSENLDNAKEKMGDIPADPVLIKAQIKALETETLNLENSLESHKKRIGTIQSDIKQARKLINELDNRKNKRFVDIGKLRAHIDEFLAGWNAFLAAEDDNATDAIAEVSRVAYEVFNKHFQQGDV
jgi:predicted  nucleic acid-binding Zn-ribbon protein